MAHQLQESFDSLEAKNADLEQAKEALAQAKEQLVLRRHHSRHLQTQAGRRCTQTSTPGTMH